MARRSESVLRLFLRRHESDKLPYVKPLLIAALAMVPLAAQNPYLGDAKGIESGREIFRIYCAPCHGLKAEGGRGPDLTLGIYSAGDTDQDLYRVIMNGVQGSEMPDYSEKLGTDNVWRVISYLRFAVRKAASMKGSSANGETLFWGKGGCGGCHMVGNRGGTMAPDLSLAGRKRSLEYLKASIVDVNQDLTPGFLTILIETLDGKKITGVQRGFDTFSAQLVDAKGAYYSFYKEEVKSMKREARSLMPSTYGKLFTDSEVDDLVAYMSTLRDKK